MELKKLTPDELIECAFVDALPQDREAIEAELRRRMTPSVSFTEAAKAFEEIRHSHIDCAFPTSKRTAEGLNPKEQAQKVVGDFFDSGIAAMAGCA